MNNPDENIRDAAMKEFMQLLGGIGDASKAAQRERQMEEMRDACKQMYSLYKGFIDAGFDKDQALQMTQHLMTIALGAQLGKEADK